MKKIVLLLVLPLSAYAGDLIKAKRDPNRDYTEYESRVSNSPKEFYEISLDGSALRSSRIFTTAQLPDATGWKASAMQERFEYMRDVRFLKDMKGNLRRSSWMYPDDGCYARAALAMRNLFRLYVPLPSKVFAFGNLRVKTENSPRGAVHWWYHVAPIVQVNGQKFVLDPSLEPAHPLTLEEWISKMGKPERIKVAICGSGTYSPGDRCDKTSDGLEIRAERAQFSYLKEEELRLRRLGREVATELGEHPPWLEGIGH